MQNRRASRQCSWTAHADAEVPGPTPYRSFKLAAAKGVLTGVVLVDLYHGPDVLATPHHGFGARAPASATAQRNAFRCPCDVRA